MCPVYNIRILTIYTCFQIQSLHAQLKAKLILTTNLKAKILYQGQFNCCQPQAKFKTKSKHCVKGWVKKTLTNWNLVFAISHSSSCILVPTPHNTLVIIWGRDKNCQVSMMLNHENKISLINVFYCSPFNCLC